MTEVEAIIDGPADTPYSGGRFRVKLSIGKDFPSSPPKGFFLTKIFHPNVSSKGEICVNTLKRDWKSDLGIKHILLTVKCLLIVPNPESALNEEAGKLLLEHYDDYCARAKLYTEIHAQGNDTNSSSTKGVVVGVRTVNGDLPEREVGTSSGVQPAEVPKKVQAVDKKVVSKKDKTMKEKKKTLKRL